MLRPVLHKKKIRRSLEQVRNPESADMRSDGVWMANCHSAAVVGWVISLEKTFARKLTVGSWSGILVPRPSAVTVADFASAPWVLWSMASTRMALPLIGLSSTVRAGRG